MKTTSCALLAFLLLLALWPAGLFAQKVKVTPEPTGRLVDLGGYSLHVNASGTGSPTVVLISGSGDFSFSWALVQPEIARTATTVSYDRAGFAWSDLGPTPRTMRQEAHELRLTLNKAGVTGPYVLVGHSVGGLIARTFAANYPKEVVGIVLVDSTTEDTTLFYQGKIVRVRDGAQKRTIPEVQSMASSPPKPPTKADLEQAEFNKQFFGEPKIDPPFDRLPAEAQALQLWALRNRKLSAQEDDYWAEELQAMHESRAKKPRQLGNMPLIVLIGGKSTGPPPGVTEEQWKQLSEEKYRQKRELALLSSNSKVIVAEKSGHHIHLDEPELVVRSVLEIVASVRSRRKLNQE